MLTLPYDVTCGYFDSSEFGNIVTTPKRTAEKFEIEFYLEDGNETFADAHAYRIRKGYVQIAKPNQVRYSHLPFKTMYLKFCVDGELSRRLYEAPEYFQSNHPEQMADIWDTIILLNESADNPLLLYSRLLALLDLVLCDSELPRLPYANSYRIVKKAKEYMERHYAESIRLSDVAAAVNLSPIYFHNVFTGTCGCTPHEFLTRKRIAEAKRLLWDPAVSLPEIAERCGFGCQQYFSKIFKKNTGTPPGKYRKDFQQQYWDESATV